MNIPIRSITNALKTSAKLEFPLLCIYGSEDAPDNAIVATKLSHCLPEAMIAMLKDSQIHTIYVHEDTKFCRGGMAWLGYQDFASKVHHFISTGKPDFRNGAAEYLVESPSLALRRLQSVGKIKPAGTYTIIQKADSIDQEVPILGILLLGRAEQIRNLSSLYYFGSESNFEVQFPWGSVCSSFITYPCNLGDKTPHDAIIIGPTDPTGNSWFPQDYLSMGIPINVAWKMASNLESSFLGKA